MQDRVQDLVLPRLIQSAQVVDAAQDHADLEDAADNTYSVAN